MRHLKISLTILVAFILAAAPVLMLMATPVQAATIPTFSIVSVTAGDTVTIKTSNFPANTNFTVRMGKFGTLGVGGTVVGTTNSGPGGTFTASYSIPADLKTANLIAIRMDATSGGWFAYNWFFNAASSGTPVPPPTGGFVGIPTFSIQSVVPDTSVTIKTNNFPAHFTFTVRMGKFGTLGVGGVVVGTTDSAAGGVFTSTYTIPDALKGLGQIAIRMDSTTGGFFAYNWFFNAAASTTPAPPPTGSTVFPKFSISSVVKDTSVTIAGSNFPAGQTFTVTMGPFGSLGIGGTVVGTTDSGSGGALTATYNIPAGLKGSSLIAIRMVSSQGFFAYNWFFNSSTP